MACLSQVSYVAFEEEGVKGAEEVRSAGDVLAVPAPREGQDGPPWGGLPRGSVE